MQRGDFQLAIDGAVRRSRRVRAARRQRRRRSAALMVCLVVSLAAGGIATIGALTGTDMVDAAVAKAQSLADLIGQRSPGARTEGQLTKTKHAWALARLRTAPTPHIVQPGPAPKADMAQVAQLLEAPPLVPASVDLQQPIALAEIGAPQPSLGGILLPGPGSGSTPPGGSPPATFPGTEPKEPLIPPPAVPEPETWATMLLGFALIGWRLRRRPGEQPKTRTA